MRFIAETLDYCLVLVQGFGRFIGRSVNFILLSFVFLFGVGLTRVFALFSGKDFLPTNWDDKTSWMRHEKSSEPYRMF